jgi:hypothetical protein
MINSRFAFLLGSFVALSLFAFSAHASQQSNAKDAEEVIKNYLSSQKSETEDAQSQGSAIADLNGDGKSEIVLVWTVLGPTYWHNTLTILTKTSEGYKAVASLNLNGEANLLSVKGGIIFVKEKVYGKKDPICCPSIKRQGKYRWVGKKIAEVK